MQWSYAAFVVQRISRRKLELLVTPWVTAKDSDQSPLPVYKPLLIRENSWALIFTKFYSWYSESLTIKRHWFSKLRCILSSVACTWISTIFFFGEQMKGFVAEKEYSQAVRSDAGKNEKGRPTPAPTTNLHYVIHTIHTIRNLLGPSNTELGSLANLPHRISNFRKSLVWRSGCLVTIDQVTLA